MDKVIHTGAGCNDSNLFRAVSKGMNSPSKSTLPAGATWPFVRLSIDQRSVEFSMLHIKKSVTPSDAEIGLSKLGYVYFRSRNHANDFGFATLRVGTLIKELRERGYRLDESCSQNMLAARISLYSVTAIQLMIVVLVTVMMIVRSSGI